LNAAGRTVGAPVNLGQIQEPFGGSQSIQRGISGLVGETPAVGTVEQALQAAGRGTGAAAGGMLTGGAMNAAQLAPALARALGGGADTLRSALTNLFAGAGAGVGQFGGQEAGQQIVGAFTDNPTAQAVGGQVGGLAGGLGGGVAAGYAPSAAHGLYDRFIGRYPGQSGVETRALDAIRRAFGRGVKGGAPDVPATREFLNQPETVAAGFTPKPLAFADVQNEPVQALGERVAQMPGSSAQTARGFLQQRDAASGPRLVTDLQENLVAGPSAYRSAQQITEQQARQSAPLYNRAFSHPQNQTIADPAIDQVLATPAGKAAFEQARTTMANEGIQVPATGPVDLRTLDYMKRALDDQVGGAIRGGAANDARVLGSVKNRLVDAMDKADASGTYARARSTFAGHAQAKNALEDGAAIFKKSPELIADEVASLSPAEKPLYLTGARDALSQRIAQTSSGGNEALKIVGNDQIQKQLRPLFDTDKAFDAFINQAKLESLMYGTKSRAIGGSQTFSRLAGAAERSPVAGIGGNALTAVGAAFTGEPVVSATSAARAMGKILSSITGLTPAVRAQGAMRRSW
jgi:hypothetical protein